MTCPECGEVFSKREHRERESHMLDEHGSYLRWRCMYCTYTTNTHRRHDHVKHWGSRHLGEPVPPRAILVPKDDEDRRRGEEQLKRQQRVPSQEPRTGTRTSPRLSRRSSPGKRTRHPSSPDTTATPSSKRASSRSERRSRRATPPQPAPRSESPSRAQHDPRSPRKQRDPRRVVRGTEPSTLADSLSATVTLDDPAPPPSPRPGPSRPGARSPPPARALASAEEELELHPPGEEFSDEEEPQTEATEDSRQVTAPFDLAIRYLREEATPDECRTAIATAEGRLARLSTGPQPAGPGVRPSTSRDAETSQPRTRLTWRSDGGLTIDTSGASIHCQGPVVETRFPPQ